MPPRTALASQSTRVLRREAYVCPSCMVKQSLRQRSTRATPLHPDVTRRRETRSDTPTRAIGRLQPRRNATNFALASSTAVGAPAAVPAHLRDLHQRLLLLQEKASSYVDLSRLQLALRSLESDDPIVRVAFLGLGNQGVQAARKLAKVLLADELGDEEQWERDLMTEDAGRSVLLKYGESGDAPGIQGASAPLVREMTIPSERLRRWRIEILITGFNAGGYMPSSIGESARELEDTILVPPVTIPNSSGGRVGFVRYPAHKALVVADGVSGAIEYGRFASSLTDDDLIRAALSLPLRAQVESAHVEKPNPTDLAHTNAISIDLAEYALDAFRANIANGVIYSDSWRESRLATISEWLAASSSAESAQADLKPAVKNMVNSIMLRASDSVSMAQRTAETSSTALTVAETKRSSLQSAIASWSEEAHKDLQVNLETVLASPTWCRTTWWRLFWRIDEVSISGSDVLRRGWLVQAEQTLAFLSGRMLEAGIASIKDLKGQAKPSQVPITREQDRAETAVSESKPGTVAELLEAPSTFVQLEKPVEQDNTFSPPWPQTIRIARNHKLSENVPAMHRKAQALLLASLSTMGGTGALAGWLWVASGGVALYEAGAIAALGLVWSLRRLQKLWSKERQAFVDTTTEDARLVLSHVEAHLRRLVERGGRVPVSEEDRLQWEEARRALESCREAVAEIGRQTGKEN